MATRRGGDLFDDDGGRLGHFYDREGNRLTFDGWVALIETHGMEYKRVAETSVGPFWISTVWLGIDHNFGFQPGAEPLIFETMIFGPEGMSDLYCERYTTEAHARSRHDEIVDEVTAGREPVDDNGRQWLPTRFGYDPIEIADNEDAE